MSNQIQKAQIAKLLRALACSGTQKNVSIHHFLVYSSIKVLFSVRIYIQWLDQKKH
jgi:hypothetical protein